MRSVNRYIIGALKKVLLQVYIVVVAARVFLKSHSTLYANTAITIDSRRAVHFTKGRSRGFSREKGTCLPAECVIYGFVRAAAAREFISQRNTSLRVNNRKKGRVVTTLGVVVASLAEKPPKKK